VARQTVNRSAGFRSKSPSRLAKYESQIDRQRSSHGRQELVGFRSSGSDERNLNMASVEHASIVSPRIERLREFVIAFNGLVEATRSEPDILCEGSRLLKELISVDDWLPARYAQPSNDGYQQYLLHADSRERFSVVSFVWGPAQKSPIHDHTVWGLVGILRGAESEQTYSRASDGCFVAEGAPVRLEQGEVTAVSPAIGDFHRVANALDDRPSTSIHIYGANIGAVRRSMYEPDGSSRTFVSGYSNTEVPNLWDRSKDKSRI
jgi:predicted metal-dependent enzyme (double-stranded beta helix superfamily)